jgi:hypothetical protein
MYIRESVLAYAIGSIVYGINLKNNSEFGEDIERLEEREAVTTEYSGSGLSPVYIGPRIDTIDECDDSEISSLKLEPTEHQKEEFRRSLNDILDDPEVSVAFKEYLRDRQPTVFITWGTS